MAGQTSPSESYPFPCVTHSFLVEEAWGDHANTLFPITFSMNLFISLGTHGLFFSLVISHDFTNSIAQMVPGLARGAGRPRTRLHRSVSTSLRYGTMSWSRLIAYFPCPALHSALSPGIPACLWWRSLCGRQIWEPSVLLTTGRFASPRPSGWNVCVCVCT